MARSHKVAGPIRSAHMRLRGVALARGRRASHGGHRGACRGACRGLHCGRCHGVHSGWHVAEVGLSEIEQPRHLAIERFLIVDLVRMCTCIYAHASIVSEATKHTAHAMKLYTKHTGRCVLPHHRQVIGAQPEWHLELERSFVQPEVAYAYEKAQRACARA